MPNIVISYRREDTKWIVGRIFDRLETHYGRDNVFMDIDAIGLGLDYRDHIRNTLDRSDIVLAVIGPKWLGVQETTGHPRIADETDWVRIEIEAALAKKIPVIPVLIDRTPLPKLNELPEKVRDLVFRQAIDLDTGVDFRSHMDRMIRAMDNLLKPRTSKARQEHAQTEAEVDLKANGGDKSVSAKILICYRRGDSAPQAERMQEWLVAEFGPDLIFMDFDNVPSGTNFVRALQEQVAKCGVLLAVIGPDWLDARDESGRRRLDDPNDSVRLEIAAALAREIRVIPILVNGARFPDADHLPEDIKELPLRNAVAVRHSSFRADMDKLIRELKKRKTWW